MTPPALSGDLKSRAEQLAEEEFEREKRRNLQLEEQRSDHNPPEQRIRAWERAHGLRMPVVVYGHTHFTLLTELRAPAITARIEGFSRETPAA